MPDESYDDDRRNFQTLRDQVRQTTPVHPAADPAADQRRRTASLQRLLSLFTGQDYGDPEDPAGGATTAADGEPKQDGMLGGSRDADVPNESGIPSASTSSAGGSWESPSAASGHGFSMPSELPTALPSGAASWNEPKFFDIAQSAGSNRSPAYEGIAKSRGDGSARLAGNLETLGDADLPTALQAANGDDPGKVEAAGVGAMETDGPEAGRPMDFGGTANRAGAATSALADDTLSTQLSGPAAALPTGLPANHPDAAAADSEMRPPSGSTDRADVAASEAGSNEASENADGAESDRGDSGASENIGGQDSDGAGAGSESGAQPSMGGAGVLSINVSIRDLPRILALAAEAGMPGFKAAAQQVLAPLSSSVETAAAQLKDINSRFDQHQMDELMKASQMRAIYRR